MFFGDVPAAMCLAFTAPGLTSAKLRAGRVRFTVLAATAVMLRVTATPPGWKLFDWYVS